MGCQHLQVAPGDDIPREVPAVRQHVPPVQLLPEVLVEQDPRQCPGQADPITSRHEQRSGFPHGRVCLVALVPDDGEAGRDRGDAGRSPRGEVTANVQERVGLSEQMRDGFGGQEAEHGDGHGRSRERGRQAPGGFLGSPPEHVEAKAGNLPGDLGHGVCDGLDLAVGDLRGNVAPPGHPEDDDVLGAARSAISGPLPGVRLREIAAHRDERDLAVQRLFSHPAHALRRHRADHPMGRAHRAPHDGNLRPSPRPVPDSRAGEGRRIVQDDRHPDAVLAQRAKEAEEPEGESPPGPHPVRVLGQHGPPPPRPTHGVESPQGARPPVRVPPHLDQVQPGPELAHCRLEPRAVIPHAVHRPVPGTHEGNDGRRARAVHGGLRRRGGTGGRPTRGTQRPRPAHRWTAVRARRRGSSSFPDTPTAPGAAERPQRPHRA